MAKELLDKRRETAEAWTRMANFLMQTVSTKGEMGTVANLEQHNLGSLNQLHQYDEKMEAVLGKLPALEPPHGYQGDPRLIMTTKLSLIKQGEDLHSRRVLSHSKIKKVELFWKPLRESEYNSKPLEREARNVYGLGLGKNEYGTQSFEYYIVVSLDNEDLRYPLEGNASVTVW